MWPHLFDLNWLMVTGCCLVDPAGLADSSDCSRISHQPEEEQSNDTKEKDLVSILHLLYNQESQTIRIRRILFGYFILLISMVMPKLFTQKHEKERFDESRNMTRGLVF
jgi:hypothetical protein